MNVAISRMPPPEYAAACVSQRPSAISRLAIFEDFAAAEPDWRALENADTLTTPYQRYDFLDPWYRHLGRRAGVRPFLIVGYDAADAPVLLCPFGAVCRGPLRVVSFLGCSHANFNMALWRRDIVAHVGQAELAAFFSQIAAFGPGRKFDILALANQPHAWDGLPNPFRLWPHQACPSSCYRGTLKPDFDELIRHRLGHAARKKLRKKMRVLSEYGRVRFERAATPEQAHDLLDVFCRQKAERMGALGVHNSFAAPGTRAFIDELAATGPQGRPPLIEVYSLSVGDTVIATISGMVGGARFCAMFNSITSGPLAKESPGDQLLYRLIEAHCERGLNSFDLGVGDARYKRMFCDEIEPLFDSFLPLTPLGRLAASGFRLAYDAKRLIKGSPALWNMVQAMRHARGRFLSPRQSSAA